jgi:AmmeMemoRadiSam system protein B
MLSLVLGFRNMVRAPAVAGRFYPADPRELSKQVDECVSASKRREKAAAIACVVPHAGYMYSGAVAGSVYGALRLTRRVVLFGPRHYPRGESLAILTEGEWKTPLGLVRVDAKLASELRHGFPRLRDDAVAHQAEHSLEVQLPFLQRLLGDFTFVPVVIGTDRFAVLEELGTALAGVLQAQPESVLMIASSDMNHYESDVVTREKDRLAIERILALDPRGLWDTVRDRGISMCGYAPTVAILTAAKLLGATRGELVSYATSGDITGDYEAVVGYAGMVIR